VKLNRADVRGQQRLHSSKLCRNACEFLLVVHVRNRDEAVKIFRLTGLEVAELGRKKNHVSVTIYMPIVRRLIGVLVVRYF
jgi:hypothetical protein